MSRTYRNLPTGFGGYCRRSPSTQQERRNYFAALDQGYSLRVRGPRRADHLPDDRSEVTASSEKQCIQLDRWLASWVGRPWDEVLRAASRVPTLRRNPLNRQKTIQRIHWFVAARTYLKNGRLWYVSGLGHSLVVERGYYVHPLNRTLCHAGPCI